MKTPMQWTIREIIEATAGSLLSGGCRDGFPAVRIDSRKVAAGDIFVAVKGPRFDGHDFIAGDVDRKAGCLVISRNQANRFSAMDFEKNNICLVAVDDTVKALGGLASYRRRQAGIPVVGITGSTGKTTTREMAMAICRRRFETLSTSGNLNNEIGLPLTMFNLSSDHQLALLELGMNHPGEISRLSAICRPDIGVITNVGPAHLEGLKDVESVAAAKGELLANIRPGGTAVLNADDPYGHKLKKTSPVRVVMFGTSDEAQVRAENISPGNGKMAFTLVITDPRPEVRIDITLNVYGAFMVRNALSAAALAHLLEIGPETIKAGLEAFRAVEGRMMIYETSGGAYVIDDTYNANPMSMEAAISALTGLTGRKGGILVAGDMLELGRAAKHHHERIGQIAGAAGISRLYLTGSYAAQVAQGAKSAGMAGNDIFVGTKTDIAKDLAQRLKRGDWVLVKGSRSTGMEEIVRQMTTGARLRTPDFPNPGDAE